MDFCREDFDLAIGPILTTLKFVTILSTKFVTILSTTFYNPRGIDLIQDFISFNLYARVYAKNILMLISY